MRAREAGIDLVCRVPPTAGYRCRQAPVKQILINLLSNAIKFTHAAEKSWSPPRSGGRLTLTVEDTASVSRGRLRHVGDPFFQVRTAYDRPHDGTGPSVIVKAGRTPWRRTRHPQPRRL